MRWCKTKWSFPFLRRKNVLTAAEVVVDPELCIGCFRCAKVAPSVFQMDESGKAQACTLAFYMVSSHIPPCVTIAINAAQRRKTLASMLRSRAFVLSFPSIDQVKEADYLGVESGYNTDKIRNIGYTITGAQTVLAPIINEFPLSLECAIVHTVTVGSHMQVTGEVKRILADESILTDKGRIDLAKLKPVIYDEERLQYLTVGEKVADAFITGMELKKTMDGGKENG